MPKLKDITWSYLLRCNPIGNGSAPVMRKEVLETIKFQDNIHGTIEDFYFDEQFRRAEDIECWLRIAIKTNWQIEGIPEALTLYRVNSGGLSANLLKQLESWEQVIEKIVAYAPELMVDAQKLAMAYYLRYLARNAIRLQAGQMAVQLIHRSLLSYWRIVLEEPRRTLSTLAAAYLLILLPRRFYTLIEVTVAKITGNSQKRRILQESV